MFDQTSDKVWSDIRICMIRHQIMYYRTSYYIWTEIRLCLIRHQNMSETDISLCLLRHQLCFIRNHIMFDQTSEYVWSDISLCLIRYQIMFDQTSDYVWSDIRLCLKSHKSDQVYRMRHVWSDTSNMCLSLYWSKYRYLKSLLMITAKNLCTWPAHKPITEATGHFTGVILFLICDWRRTFTPEMMMYSNVMWCTSQQTRDIELMFDQCRTNIVDKRPIISNPPWKINKQIIIIIKKAWNSCFHKSEVIFKQ